METFDYGIIGGGPAGYSTALYAAEIGKSVVLFEKDEVGGTCLNRGCIPTKILLHISHLYHQMKTVEKFGLSAENVSFDYEKVCEHKDKTIQKLRKSLELAMKQAKINIVKNEAKIVDNNIIECSGVQYKCENVVFATGSKPRQLKGLEYDHDFILSSDDILELRKLPQKIVIVGSGAIGVEFARLMSDFGVEVALVEIADTLLPLADWEVSKRIERQFKMKKIKYYTSTSISEVDKTTKTITLSNDEKITTDCILVSAGREAGANNCHSELVSESNQKSQIQIIGDASAEIQLAHYAVSQAKKLVFDINFNKDLIPSVVYGSPEIAWVGKVFKNIEDEKDYKKIVFPISALGKAHADDSIDGFIKIVAKEDYIVGASIVSNEASALIQQITIAIQNNITLDKLKEVCFPHPTYSEGVMEGLMKL